MRSTWTDSRLDDLNNRVSELSGRVNEMGGRIDRLQHRIVHGFIAIMVAMMTGFMGLAGVLITKL